MIDLEFRKLLQSELETSTFCPEDDPEFLEFIRFFSHSIHSQKLAPLVRRAKVILGYDTDSGGLFLLYGRQELANGGEGVRLILELDHDSWELELCCFFIEGIKGRHDYGHPLKFPV